MKVNYNYSLLNYDDEVGGGGGGGGGRGKEVQRGLIVDIEQLLLDNRSMHCSVRLNPSAVDKWATKKGSGGGYLHTVRLQHGLSQYGTEHIIT